MGSRRQQRHPITLKKNPAGLGRRTGIGLTHGGVNAGASTRRQAIGARLAAQTAARPYCVTLGLQFMQKKKSACP